MAAVVEADLTPEILGSNQGHLSPQQLQNEIELKQDRLRRRMRHAILVAVQREYAAVLSVFGPEKRFPSREHPDSPVKYVELSAKSGEQKLLLIAGISDAGIAQAAAFGSQIKWANPHVSKIIMVGIAAGQPSLDDAERDVRLGDIVVADSVVQYDHRKIAAGGEELRGNRLPKPDAGMMQAVNSLRALQELTDQEAQRLPWITHIEAGSAKLTNAARPDPSKDPKTDLRKYETSSSIVRRVNEPFVHVGLVASGSLLIKDEKRRDQLHGELKALAYEMEGAGLAIASGINNFGYVVIRGICDYADKEKNDDWQRYAALCAASFARALIEEL
jgi:nucleoside phosphorylase